MKVKILQQVIGISLTVWLIYMSYFETGLFTTIIISLMAITFKLQELINTKTLENVEGIADILGRMTGVKK